MYNHQSLQAEHGIKSLTHILPKHFTGLGQMWTPKDYLATEDKKEDATIAKPPLKEESKMGEQTSRQEEEKCDWGPNCPFCKAQRKDGEDQQQKPLPKPQAKRPDTLSMTKMRQQWEEEMERLNTKYNLGCFSDSELDSESDEGEQYQYEHGYEMLI